MLLKSLLDVWHILTHNTEKRHLLNVVFISDYLLFVQQEPESVFTTLGEALARLRVNKADTQWPLEALERETEG